MADLPVIGFDSIVTATNITASAESAGFPASALGNPLTYDRFRAPVTGDSEGKVYLFIDAGSAVSVDYFGIAAHNLGTIAATVTLYGANEAGLATTLTQFGTASPTDDAPLLVLETALVRRYWVLCIDPGAVTATEEVDMGVLFIGARMTFERCVRGKYRPLPYSRVTEFNVNRSMNGQFVGRTIQRKGFKSSVSFDLMSAAWVRSTFQLFVKAARTSAYFFAWKPDTYPGEVAFVDTADDIAVEYTGDRDRMSAAWEMQGLGWDE